MHAIPPSGGLLNLTTINIRKPIYVGLATLELLKICVYKIHLGLMTNNFEDNCTMCYTDMDSFVYLIQDHDV